jgi:hypothetical protein
MSEIADRLALILSALFAVAAALNLSAPGFVRRVYQRWAFPRGFYYVAGLAQVLTALFLSVPATRIWGGALGLIVLFFTTVSLLNHRKYIYALSAILVLVALAPAMA